MRARIGVLSSEERLLRRLAEFRFQLRQFLLYSERASAHAGVQPQQHQLLLQIAGKPDGRLATIAYAAERLGLQHHSVVELVDRSVRERLLARGEDSEDARRVILTVTKKGRRVLDELSADHACELREMGPRLVRALDGIGSIEDATERPAREGQRKRSVKTPKGGRRRGP
jgi:DNA-binding MarR family transcriptional regulator